VSKVPKNDPPWRVPLEQSEPALPHITVPAIHPRGITQETLSAQVDKLGYTALAIKEQRDEALACLRQVRDFWAGGDAPQNLTDQINAILAKADQ
jgi:hypothetical protein